MEVYTTRIIGRSKDADGLWSVETSKELDVYSAFEKAITGCEEYINSSEAFTFVEKEWRYHPTTNPISANRGIKNTRSDYMLVSIRRKTIK